MVKDVMLELQFEGEVDRQCINYGIKALRVMQVELMRVLTS